MSSDPRDARSIRAVLLAGTAAILLAVLGAAAWLSFEGSEEEAQELFDARLATSARVLEAFLARQIEHATVAAPIVIALPGPIEANMQALSRPQRVADAAHGADHGFRNLRVARIELASKIVNVEIDDVFEQL